MEKEKGALPDLTGFDFSCADLYRSDPEAMPLRAEELVEGLVIERFWGKQEMVSGDWLYKPGLDGGFELSGVR